MSKSRIGAAVLALSLPAVASAAEVAILKTAEVPGWRPAIDALKRAAAAHTVTEYDLRNDRAEAERVLGGLKGKGAVLVALGPLAATAAKEQIPDGPLIIGFVPDPARVGMAGVSGVAANIPVKNQLAAFRMVNPRGVRIGVVFSQDNVGAMVADAEKASSVLRVLLVTRPVASEKDVPAAIRSLVTGADAVDAVWIPPDPLLLGESRQFVLSECLKNSKPVYSFSAALEPEGALVSNGPDFVSMGEQLGELVNRMAGGEKSKGDMLIPRAELIINKKIGDKLKIDIPPDALKAAAKVY